MRADWVLPLSGRPIQDGAVLLEGGVIVACDRAANLLTSLETDIQEFGDCVIAPGFVDAHCHLEWSLLGGLIASMPFASWLRAFTDTRRRLPGESPLAGARLAAVLALEAGTTTVADSGPAGAGVAALTEAGLRGNVYVEVFRDRVGADAEGGARRLAERLATLDDDAGPHVRVGVSPHAPYTVDRRLWAELARQEGLRDRPWSTHVAESTAEVSAILTGSGPLADLFRERGFQLGRWDGTGSVVERLAVGGALRRGLIAAHCVEVDERDAALLAEGGVAVAHCPMSNTHLRCGVAPLATLRRVGVPVALGTDSPASGGPYDLRAEARACRDVQSMSGVAPSARELVEMMTVVGARALGRGDAIGALRPGMRADLTVVRAPVAGWGGAADPYERLLHPDAPIGHVVVDGQTLLDAAGPRRVPRDRILADAERARSSLC
ncbi:MAG: amidohydrolase family protein [Actinobacteria bacterium]|nr:amidohydrolase family protein [Actinomycetota bacterium]